MSDIAIKVENLSKRYTISHKGNGSGDGLRHILQDKLAAPFRKLFHRNGASPSVSQPSTLNHQLPPDSKPSSVTQLSPQHHGPLAEPRISTLNSQPSPHSQPSSEDFYALRDVSFEVKQGEVVGIIGRNGAGKSTLLKILSRITEPTSGRITINGRVASLLEVGTGFHPELTGRENIFLNGAILGMSRVEIKSRFDEIVAFAEIEKFLDTPVKRYSSGMYVRLAFAVAAHLEPEILIVDEVLAVGDAQFQKKCLGKMQEVSKQGGRTVLFVSHNMTAIIDLCSSGILLQSGTILLHGQTREAVSNYLNDGLHSETGSYDIRSHPSRSRGCFPLITKVSLFSANGTPTNRFFPEESPTIEISIEAHQRIERPRLAFAIEDSCGRRIMTMASWFTDELLPDFNGQCVIRCVAAPLRLGTGRYLFSVSVSTVANGYIDSIDGAGWFEVDWHNNYGNSEPYLPAYGPVLTTSSWSLKS